MYSRHQVRSHIEIAPSYTPANISARAANILQHLQTSLCTLPGITYIRSTMELYVITHAMCHLVPPPLVLGRLWWALFLAWSVCT